MNPLIERFLGELYSSIGGDEGLSSASGGGFAYAIAAHISAVKEGAGILVPSEEEARKLHIFLRSLLGETAAPTLLPVPGVDPYSGLPVHSGILLNRAAALTRAATSTRPLLLASTPSFLYKVPKLGWWKGALRVVERGARLDRQAFRLDLWRFRYRNVDIVGETGEAAFRGGIVDIFPPTEVMPVRMEFFGDDVESLRHFDPVSQRSLDELERPVLIHPLSEVVKDDELIERMRAELAVAGSFGEIRLEGLNANGSYPSFDVEARYDDGFFAPLTDFLRNAHWVVATPAAVVDTAGNTLKDLGDSFTLHERPSFLAPDRLFAGLDVVKTLVKAPNTVAAADRGDGAWERLPSFPAEPYRLLKEINRRVVEGFRCLALLRGRGSLERLAEMALSEDLLVNRELPSGGNLPPGLYTAVAPVEAGIVFPPGRWLAFTEREIFGRGRIMRVEATRRREAFSTGIRDLKPGNRVIHVEHGMGLYQGLKTLVRGGVREDYLVLDYAGNTRLLLPVTRMDLVQRYVGPEGFEPPLDKLGGAAWKKNKARARKAVRKVAVDLMRLYAARKSAEGHAFSSDTAWQAEFESQFPYSPTPDQENAVREVKADLESNRPMDRLVCGDVGFGKTEVAMRAAFKVVQENRQVAILCPTTVLSLQHLERFRERFAPFPVRVEMLSRFLSSAEQRRVVEAAVSGEVDILIGTHRLLSKDVLLPSLGLLVVDEEQRFGVTHKEKIKALKEKVDVLTLTATPIPRTLQMGLSGILSMSLIQTPPKDRLSIQTTVRPFDRELITSAIRRELARNGQVFYIHNKVETIVAVAGRIQRWVPGARVVTAHGRMNGKELEAVMMAFFRGDYDVLVSTTIIENGMDLSRANTLLVEDAQNFGLTQLYQLRGRIGRSDVPAYAYLLTPPGMALKGNAAKRLDTLQEFSELGAGFRVAAADLEIRGAGNFLGAEQSGHMAAVGFELYTRMLEEAVAEARGRSRPIVNRCELSLGLDLSVPVEYMEGMNQRLSFYRELSLASSEEGVEKIAERTEDRFGPVPVGVRRMLDMVKLRIKAENLAIKTIAVRNGNLEMSFDPGADLDTAGLVSFLSGKEGVRLDPGGALSLPLEVGEEPMEAAGKIVEAADPSSRAKS